MSLFQLPFKLILGSKSPRRQQLLQDLGFEFSTKTQEVNENYPSTLKRVEIAEYLAAKKANAFLPVLKDKEVVLTSDTVVWCSNESLEKAKNEEEARQMLQKISGRSHEVITAFCLSSNKKSITISDICVVHFSALSSEEIEYYVKTFQPYDKAGAYGIQEWIGMWAIEKIEGSYFTVMGLPTHLLAKALQKF